MKKFKFIFLILVLIPLSIVIFNHKPNNIESKYNNLENAYLDYVDYLFMNKSISIDKINSDLASFDYTKQYMAFKDKDLILSFTHNTSTNYFDSIDLEMRNDKGEKLLSVSSFDNYYNIFSCIRSNNISVHSDFISCLSSDFDLELIKNNQDDLNLYFDLLKVVKDKGYVNIDECKDILNLKLNTPPEEIDSTSSLKLGYFKIYRENNYLISTYDDIVVNLELNISSMSNANEYSISFSMYNDFIYSDENEAKLFVLDRDIKNVLNSSTSFISSFSIHPDYDKGPFNDIKSEFNKLYKFIFN